MNFKKKKKKKQRIEKASPHPSLISSAAKLPDDLATSSFKDETRNLCPHQPSLTDEHNKVILCNVPRLLSTGKGAVATRAQVLTSDATLLRLRNAIPESYKMHIHVVLSPAIFLRS